MCDEIVIDLWTSWNFENIKNIIRTYNLTVRFSKFTLNIEIYEEFIESLQTSLERNFVQSVNTPPTNILSQVMLGS